MDKQKLSPGVSIGILVILVIIFFAVVSLFNLSPFVVVGTGERGVVMNFQNVSDTVLDEGLHFKIPFVQSVKTLSVRVRKTERPTTPASSNGQDVKMLVVMNWQLQPKKVNQIYQEIGADKDVENIAIFPAIDGIVRAETSKFTAQEILDKRTVLEQNIIKTLKERVTENYPIVVRDIYITNVSFSDKVNAAIEDKAEAEQRKLQASILADKAFQDGQAKINIASAEAQAQRLQQQTLTPLLIQKQFVEALEKGMIKLPNTVVLGNGQDLSDFILNIAQ